MFCHGIIKGDGISASDDVLSPNLIFISLNPAHVITTNGAANGWVWL